MIVPYGDKIIVKRVGEENKSSLGVVKTSSNKEKPLTVSIYRSAIDGLNENELLLIARYSGMEFEYNGVDLIAITEDDIIAKVKK